MFVRQLIGREAGKIINLEYSAAQSCVDMGTAAKVTDDEIAAAGLEVEPVAENQPEEFPRGFRVEVTPGGFDLFDPGGVNISQNVSLPNLAAARDLAWSVVNPAAPVAEPSPLEKLNKSDLLKIAEEDHVEIASSAKKADIIAALISAGITAPPEAPAGGEGGGSDGSGDDGAGDGASANGGGSEGGDGASGDQADGESNGRVGANGQAK